MCQVVPLRANSKLGIAQTHFKISNRLCLSLEAKREDAGARWQSWRKVAGMVTEIMLERETKKMRARSRSHAGAPMDGWVD